MACGQFEALDLGLIRRHSFSSRLPLDEDYLNSMPYRPPLLSRETYNPLIYWEIWNFYLSILELSRCSMYFDMKFVNFPFKNYFILVSIKVTLTLAFVF